VTHDSRFLDRQYTIWGRVVKGMEFVDKIKKGAGRDGRVDTPDIMIKVRLASDFDTKKPKTL
jgi:peptidylprolyl isomerase